MTDALYFRVSTDRQTAENQFQDVLKEATVPDECRNVLGVCIALVGDTKWFMAAETIDWLAVRSIYVDQGRSAKPGSERPMFEHMLQDARAKKFERLFCWKVSRLGRDMREVISTVYELADLGITVVPVKSQTGPITSTMGKLLWAIQAWYAEMENGERADAIRAGQARARAEGKHMGRPRAVFDRLEVIRLRQQGVSWAKIASRLHQNRSAVVRAYRETSSAFQGVSKVSRRHSGEQDAQN